MSFTEPVDLDEPEVTKTKEPHPSNTISDISAAVMKAVSNATDQTIRQLDDVIQKATELKRTLKDHQTSVENEVKERDKHARDVLMNHSQFLESSRANFDSIKTAFDMLNDNHLIKRKGQP